MKFKYAKNKITAYADETTDLSGTGFKVGDSVGYINIKTGKYGGASTGFLPLIDELERYLKENTKVSYKLWIVIEKHTIDTKTGEEFYEDLKDIDETRSVVAVDTLEEAVAKMNELATEFEDLRSEDNKF